MTLPTPYDYSVTEVIRVVDGDTYDLRLTKPLDFGFNFIETKQFAARFRLLGVDAWESNEAGGAKATRDATAWLNDALSTGVLRARTYKSVGLVPDGAFGRWLIEPYRGDTSEKLSDFLRHGGDVDLSSKWTK